jgi:hypothetical protein
LKNFTLRAALCAAFLASILSAQVQTPPGPATGSASTTLVQSTATMPALAAKCTSYNLDYINYQTGERRGCVNGVIATLEPLGFSVKTVGVAIASATTIAPVSPITHITGTTDVVTITAPSALATTGNGGCIQLVPDGIFHTTNADNIALATTAVVSKVLTECYDNATSKWYPSY